MVGTDIAGYCKAKNALDPKSYAAPTNGTSVDLKGYDGCVIFVTSGLIGATTCTFEVKDSPDNSVFTAVDDKYLTGTEASLNFGDTDDNKTKRIGYKGPQRYVRFDLTACGVASLLSAVYVLGVASDIPVTQD